MYIHIYIHAYCVYWIYICGSKHVHIYSTSLYTYVWLRVNLVEA